MACTAAPEGLFQYYFPRKVFETCAEKLEKPSFSLSYRGFVVFLRTNEKDCQMGLHRMW